MSDHLHLENEVEAIQSVTFEEIVSYLTTSGAVRSCEACGNESWSVGMDDGKPILATLPTFDKPTITLSFILICKNCGNTRLSSAKHVARAVIQTRAKSS